MTAIQMETWDYCAEYHSYSGFGPTLHEVAHKFGLKSVASAAKRINGLIKMGFLKRLPGKKSRLEVLLVPDRGMKRLDEVMRMVDEQVKGRHTGKP